MVVAIDQRGEAMARGPGGVQEGGEEVCEG